jgi:hypothetical protein
MLKFLLLITFLFSSLAHAQDSGEFDVIDAPIQLNQQDSLNPDKQSDTNSVPNNVPFDVAPADNAAKPQEDSGVMVKTREEEKPPTAPGEYVEVRTGHDVFAPYKQRQNDWGMLISLGAEQVVFKNLLTQVGISNGDNFTFEEMFGKNGVSMLDVELGPKFNTALGSFALVGGYGYFDQKDGRVSNFSTNASVSHIEFKRYSLTVNYYLDMVFNEPYFVPYVAGGMWTADYRETSTAYPGAVGAHSPKPGVMYKFGALIGLDWIEGDAAARTRKNNGLKESFLNVFAVTTEMSEANADPDLSQDMSLGASLVLEF